LSTAERVAVLVVGAGPAGLAASAELRRRGIDHQVFERGPRIGHNWRRLYDSLTLHTGKHLSALPGLRLGRGVPVFPPRDAFVEYLEQYAWAFDLPIELGRPVTRVDRDASGWVAETASGEVRANVLVIATGIMSNPRTPQFEGHERYQGRVLHSVDYRRPEEFVGRRVLVVGVGNSGGEIGSELARAGAKVTVAVRSGAHVVPRDLFGIPVQYLSLLLRALPRAARNRVARAFAQVAALRRGPPVLPRPAHGPLDAIPLIGFHLVDAIREGLVTVRGSVEAFTEDGVRFSDGRAESFDFVMLATGFAPALRPLRGLVRLDDRGFARRSDRVTSADQPDLFFVGHNYDAAGGLFNIARDAKVVGRAIADRLGASRRRG
jgi:cation diffusion facilitator CzcD-associated flavoprotein CzcO